MIRGMSIIAIAASGFSASAFAEPAKQVDVKDNQANTKVMNDSAASQEARNHLAKQGYTQISDLSKDDSGRWTGTASKDGKTIFVAIDLRKPTDVEEKAKN